MTDSPERASLQTLATTLQKALNALKKTMAQEHGPKRDKKIYRIMAEVELVNDEAMRRGLNFTNQYIAKLKTGGGSGSRSPASNTSPKVETPFQQLMAHHARNIVGPIPDPGAQGAAIKWILESFTPELAIKKYNSQLEQSNGNWRVSWLTVKKDIGRIQPNGVRPLDASERNAARYSENLEFISDLRGGTSGDYH
jgi:hypothetical protein